MSDRQTVGVLSVWVAFAIGITAGAAVALLYAPQTGVKTRRQLRRGLENAGDYLKDAADTIGDHAERYVQRGKEFADNVADKASSTYDAARKVVPI